MKNKWIVGLMAVLFISVSAAAQNSYMAQPKSGSSFGNDKNLQTEQTVNDEKTTATHKSSAAFQNGNWGIGLRLGIGQNDPKGIKELYDYAFELGWSEAELTESNVFGGLEVLYEWPLNENQHKIGFKVGIEGYGENKLELDDGDGKATENTYAIPITLYYKLDNGIKKWSWIAGVGITSMHSEWKFRNMGITTIKESKGKVFPHIILGTEYRFSQLFALGVEARYNIAAKIKKDDMVLSDRSGFGAVMTGRFYF